MTRARIHTLVPAQVILGLVFLAWTMAPPALASSGSDSPPAADAPQQDGAGERTASPRDDGERYLDKFLFHERTFLFQTLWRAGLIATGGGDLGEILTVASQIKDGDTESWHLAWNGMAVKLRANADAYFASGHTQSAMQAYFRATNAFRAAGVYEYGDERGVLAWQAGRDTFMKAAALSQGRIQPVRIPYEQTTLPGYLVTPDNSRKKRPLFLLQTGLDGTAEDLYFLLGAEAVKRGYNCLIFEGPGQGEMIIKQGLPFRPDWEKVVTPVVDFAMTLPGVDAGRMAIFGPSMSVPRALAFEKRIKWGIADGGVWSVYEGTLKQLPEAVRKIVDSPAQAATVDALVAQEMGRSLGFRHAINQRLWIFKAGSPSDLFRKLKPYTVADTVGKIEAEMLVVNSSADKINDSFAQAKQFYNALVSKKTYLELDASQGAQSHCQVGAPLVASENMFNWLDERAKP
ncbi:alpha/beta hydrolase family protein [Desulfolutivibrio sp.]|uniref:alpha/beta hydrolase family protein n=1 Tax=Desulfolutivibrio sp. TaxID=2773296 RepID=UPI002F96583E